MKGSPDPARLVESAQVDVEDGSQHPGMSAQLATATTAELLALYGGILTLLRERGIVRSENSPVGDYAEHLAPAPSA